jgi:hypothetical protein
MPMEDRLRLAIGSYFELPAVGCHDWRRGGTFFD